MANKIYPYAVAAVRSMENKLLTKNQLLQMADAKTAEDAFKLFKETTYGKDNNFGIDEFDNAISSHLSDVYSSVSKLIEGNFTDVFLIKNDYHNLKVLIKSEISGKNADNFLIDGGTIPVGKIVSAFRERKFNELASIDTKAINEAFEMYSATKNAKYIDFIMDKACFRAMKEAVKKTKLSYAVDYVTKLADITNLKTLFRICEFSLNPTIMEEAYVEGGSLSKEFFNKAALENDFGSVIDTEYKSLYDEAVSVGIFEKNCDDYIMNFIKEAKYKSLTGEPIVAYILAKENEARILKTILTCKISGIASETIKERVRETYV